MERENIDFVMPLFYAFVMLQVVFVLLVAFIANFLRTQDAFPSI